MKSYVDNSLKFPVMRAHPWTFAEHDPRGRYVDFKKESHLIEETLEDFHAFSHYSGVRKFYELIRELNDPIGALETNDCGLRPPNSHNDSNSTKTIVVHARLCLMYRDHRYNLPPGAIQWLIEVLQDGLEKTDRELKAQEAVIGLTAQPTAYVSVPSEIKVLAGQLVMLSFWAYGDSDAEAFDTLGRMAENVRHVTSNISAHIRERFNHDAIVSEVAELRESLILPDTDEIKRT